MEVAVSLAWTPAVDKTTRRRKRGGPESPRVAAPALARLPTTRPAAPGGPSASLAGPEPPRARATGRGAGPREAPPPRRDLAHRGPKPRGEAAGASEPLGPPRLPAVPRGHRATAPRGRLAERRPRARPARRVVRVPGGPHPPRVRAGRVRGGARREAARDAALQVRLPGAPLRAGRRGPPSGEDPAAGQGGQGELREAVPGGRRPGQRRLRHGLRGQPPRRRAPGGGEARGQGAGDGVGQPGRRGRAPGGGAPAQGGRGGRRARRHPPAGLVRAARRLPAGAGAAGARAGPLRLHHGARRPGRAPGAPLLRAGAGGRAPLPRLRGGAPRHQGREPAGGPALGRAQAHRLRLGRAAQGHGLHRLRRHPSVQPPGVDPLPPVPRALGHGVVPGSAAVRHGLRGRPLRAGRGDPARPPALPEEALPRVPAAHRVVSLPAALGEALPGPDRCPPLDAGGRRKCLSELRPPAPRPGRG